MYQSFRSIVEADLSEVNEYIIDQLHSDVPLVENIGHYIVDAGGKRMRPILVLLTARSCDIQSDEHIKLATVIEFIHTATLLHDDVVDMSNLRRGRPTVNAEWNNPSSVLVGDFIYSRAFQIMVRIGNMQIMEIMADTTNKIAEGEVLQLINKNNPDTNEASYLQVIERKTAILFKAASQCAAILAHCDSAMQDAFGRCGMHLGIAFQLVDDILDYAGDAKTMGKNVGDDLAEGKPTLPLIHAMEHGSDAETRLIRECIQSSTVKEADLHRIIDIVQSGPALDYTRQMASLEAEKALTALHGLAPSEYREGLETMIEFSINRQS